jgi:hypothetical protein
MSASILGSNESVQTTVTVATSSTNLVRPNPRRIALAFNAPPTNRYTISLELTALLDQGITMYPTNNPFVLTVLEHGDWVRRGWAAISATASQSITIIELFQE